MLHQLSHSRNGTDLMPVSTTGESTEGREALEDDQLPSALRYEGKRSKHGSKGHVCAGIAKRDVFRYMFKGPGLAADDDVVAKLDALAAAMTAKASDSEGSGIAPIFTYWGQFIDHDITANTDREDQSRPRFNIAGLRPAPVERSDVELTKLNLRRGTLGLDSLYGDGPEQSDAARRAEAAMRDPDEPAKMRLGLVSPRTGHGPGHIELPTDRRADVPRFGAVLDEGNDLSLEDVRELADDPLNPKSEEDLRRLPLIGDGRNDENLIISQFHLAFLRLHNHFVDAIKGRFPKNDEDGLHLEARRLTVWTYQWLVVNQYLPTICDPRIVREVLDTGAPVYGRMIKESGRRGDPCALPMPLEFSVAAFRFGHSMVRSNYDFNRNFGQEAINLTSAPLRLLFQFTGSGGFDPNNPTEVLPDNWLIEWDRFIEAQSPDRVARRIDANLALPLDELPDSSGRVPSGVLALLAARNLRRSYVLSLPTAQSVLEDLRHRFNISIVAMTEDELLAGPTGAAVAAGGFQTATPLWFYILAEADSRADGKHLGPLGSLIVAETLIGLLLADSASYLSQSWPDDGASPTEYRSIEDVLHASDLMER